MPEAARPALRIGLPRHVGRCSGRRTSLLGSLRSLSADKKFAGRFLGFWTHHRVYIFDEHGAILHKEDESPDGCVRRGTFDREFAGNKGDYYRIPPESSVRDCTATYVDLAAAYGGMGRRSITGREDRLAAAWFAGAAARAGIPAGSSTFCCC